MAKLKPSLFNRKNLVVFFSYIFEWTGLLVKTKNRFEELNQALKVQIEQDH